MLRRSALLCLNKIMRCDRVSPNIVHLAAFIACLANEMCVKYQAKKALNHPMSSPGFYFACLLNELGCNFPILSNNSRPQDGSITMEGTPHLSNKLWRHIQELDMCFLGGFFVAVQMLKNTGSSGDDAQLRFLSFDRLVFR